MHAKELLKLYKKECNFNTMHAVISEFFYIAEGTVLKTE